ncbi:BQ2448_3385 [Microbotryum intermedium]|uniref:BQ2448_3385 protein n=1 Tax=Microbotryum intermedium TaxID=269621 RepID=A0A238FF47_9BASI|nr:BQ2448_3385 [Microbotryum intermedium]
MRITSLLAFTLAISEGVLAFKYWQGEGQIVPNVTYLFKLKNPNHAPANLTIYDACQHLYYICDNFVKPLSRKEKDGVHYAHHALYSSHSLPSSGLLIVTAGSCRSDFQELPYFYAGCGYRFSPTPGVPTTFDKNEIPIDATYAALHAMRDYQIYPRGDEALRGIDITAHPTSHSDHGHRPVYNMKQHGSRSQQGHSPST